MGTKKPREVLTMNAIEFFNSLPQQSFATPNAIINHFKSNNIPIIIEGNTIYSKNTVNRRATAYNVIDDNDSLRLERVY